MVPGDAYQEIDEDTVSRLQIAKKTQRLRGVEGILGGCLPWVAVYVDPGRCNVNPAAIYSADGSSQRQICNDLFLRILETKTPATAKPTGVMRTGV